MAAWDARHLSYVEKAYTLRFDFREVRSVCAADRMEKTFQVAQSLQSNVADGPIFYSGPAALEKALGIIDPAPPAPFTGMLVHFVLPLGARRSHDAMQFMSLLGKAEVAKLYESRARLYGCAQYHAVMENWNEVVLSFKQLAEIEVTLVEMFTQSEAVA